MSGIWQFLLLFGSNHPDKQNNYKWFVIVNLPQRTTVKALNKAELQKTLISAHFLYFFIFFVINFVLIEHVTFLFPGGCILTDGWKQTRPSKKACVALWLKLSVWVGREQGLLFIWKKEGGDRARGHRWRLRGWWLLCGGGGSVQPKESPVTRAGSFMFSGFPLELSNIAIYSMCSLWAPPGCWALTLNLHCCWARLSSGVSLSANASGFTVWWSWKRGMGVGLAGSRELPGTGWAGWEEEDKTRGTQQCYGLRKKNTEAMYVGGGLFMMWGRVMMGQKGEHRSGLAASPATISMFRICLHISSCC